MGLRAILLRLQLLARTSQTRHSSEPGLSTTATSAQAVLRLC